MNALYIVEGLGGSRRSRDGAARRVVDAAVTSGWIPSIVTLGEMAELVARPSGAGSRVVLCGGDGLIHRALRYLTDVDVDVAVVPVGSGNDFARAFGITAESSIGLAAAPADTATPHSGVDVIAVDSTSGRPDVLAASVLTAGYTGRVNATANRMRFPPGSAKYTVAALREIGRLATVDVRLVLTDDVGDDEQIVDGPLTMFAIGNTGYFGGGMHICPAADASDGALDVVAVGPIGKLEFARWLPSVFRGEHLGHPAVTVGRARRVRIETSELLWADGEALDVGDRHPDRHDSVTVRTATVRTVTVRQGALRLLRPLATS